MKKKLSIVLAVVLTVTLLLTYATFAVGWVWPSTEYENMLDMTAFSKSNHACGPSSGVSIGRYYREAIDRDEEAVIEDFEWGNDGDSLATSGGDVDWTVTRMSGWWGNSVAEIDTEVAHGESTKSARLYRGDVGDGSYMQASYLQAPPTYRKFYFYFEEGSDAVLYTTNGDGDNRIFVRVSIQGDQGDDFLVESYDGANWNPLWVYYQTWFDKWHYLELENIDWVNATYDISCDGWGANGVDMAETPSGQYNGMTAYYNVGAMGSECWIDDILDERADYPYLPDPDPEEEEDGMFYALYDCMGTGGDYPEGSTATWNYGPGFVEMTEDAGYDNFIYANDWDIATLDDFWAIKGAIDKGWPVALAGNFKDVDEIPGSDPSGDWPPDKGHYIAIRGYGYSEYVWIGGTHSHYLICTDSYCDADELELSWYNLINYGTGLRAITIMDNVLEDFEWGIDGASLATSGGDVEWTVSTSGNSKAEIDTAQEHSGTRSARLYRDGTYNAWAKFDQTPLTSTQSLSCYFMKQNASNFGVYHGNGQKVVCYYYTTDEKLKWYDGTWHDTGVTISNDAWYLTEVKNIDWTGGTYDLYHNGVFVETANLRTHTAWNSIVRIYNTSGTSVSWFDDVTVSVG